MSRPFSRYLHRLDVAHHPSFEPEVKRAILASWASGRDAAENRSALSKCGNLGCATRIEAARIDNVLAAPRTLGGQDGARTLQ